MGVSLKYLITASFMVGHVENGVELAYMTGDESFKQQTWG